MVGKVEQIYPKYFDAARMRGKVGTLIRDKKEQTLCFTLLKIERAS